MNGRKPCILVTGGATPLHRRIRLTLRAEGYDVLKASSYSRAVAMTHGYRPDLVLLYMDVARQQVHVDSEPVYLTPKEFHLLYLLLLHAGKVLTHRFLLQQVWGEGYSEEKSYVRVCICQLRKKIAHDYILTQTTVG